jgi:hypothetical protein
MDSANMMPHLVNLVFIVQLEVWGEYTITKYEGKYWEVESKY